jgi:hypothetical protein
MFGGGFQKHSKIHSSFEIQNGQKNALTTINNYGNYAAHDCDRGGCRRGTRMHGIKTQRMMLLLLLLIRTIAHPHFAGITVHTMLT